MSNRIALIGALLAFAWSGPAIAGDAPSPGVDFTGVGQSRPTNDTWTLGYEFVANADATVVGLATWDSWFTDPASVRVGLWDASGHLLAATTVTNASPTIGSADWSWSALLRPVTLTAGDTYYVGSFGPDAGYSFSNAGFTVDPLITFIQDAYVVDSSGLAFPNATYGSQGTFGGNVILAAAAPEASTWAMMILGFAGLGLAGHRVRRAASAAA